MQQSQWLLNVRDLVGQPGQMRMRQVDVTTHDDFGTPVIRVVADSPIALDVKLESVHEGILVTGSAEAELAGECSRCLKSINETTRVDFGDLFAYPGADDYEYHVVDDSVDIEDLVRSSVVLSLPFQPVCTPNCAGLCPECGVRLDDDPGHHHEAPVDARWSALEALRDSNE